MSYRGLRKALLARLNVSSAALSMRARRLTNSVPMALEDATCVLAHQHGLPIDRYLEAEQLARVRDLISQSRSTSQAATKAATSGAPGRKTKAVDPVIQFQGMPGIKGLVLGNKKLKEAAKMAEVYPLLYVLENSIREVIKRVMDENYGPDWWETTLTRGGVKSIRDTAQGRMRTEEKKHAWHQRRGSHPIDYTNFSDLAAIIAARQDDFFPDVITDRDTFEHVIVKQVEPSRNVLCHMNPLETQSITDIKSALNKWNRMIGKTVRSTN